MNVKVGQNGSKLLTKDRGYDAVVCRPAGSSWDGAEQLLCSYHKLYAALSGPNKQHRLVMRGSYEFLMWKVTAVKLHKKKVSYRSLKQRWRKHPDYFPVCRKCEDVLDLKCYF